MAHEWGYGVRAAGGVLRLHPGSELTHSSSLLQVLFLALSVAIPGAASRLGELRAGVVDFPHANVLLSDLAPCMSLLGVPRGSGHHTPGRDYGSQLRETTTPRRQHRAV